MIRESMGTCARASSVPTLDLFIITQTLEQAKADLATKGRGNAYHSLLNHFHFQILPLFLQDTNGNLSETAKLLGLHRGTVGQYVKAAHLDPKAFAQGGKV